MKKRMKMKLLDFTLISLLAGSAPMAAAQTATPVQAQQDRAEETATQMDCDGERCMGEDGLLFRLRTRSYDKPVTQGTSQASSSEVLQPDRRVTVAMEQPGKATAMGKFSIDLPGGGVIWATEDPALGQPELSVSAPSIVPFDGQRITKPVSFYVRGNYPAFIKRLEVTLYRSSDGDLIEPIATIPLDVAGVTRADWDGALPSRYPFRKGDELVYVLRAYDGDSRFDETHPRTLQLVSPEEAERGADLLRSTVERTLGSALTTAQAESQSLIDTAFAENGLRQQNIPMYGSRIRIQGRNLPPDVALKINGEDYPVDQERKFVAEFLQPVGPHRYQVQVKSSQGMVADTPLDVNVSGRYAFVAALADLTLSRNDAGGGLDALASDIRQDDGFLREGRLAFYAKGKWKGRYLLTAQADTWENDLEHLFDGFLDARPNDIFRRLDPDLYYPVYGDDSRTWRDVDTQGKLYLRLDWDQNQALWGNYATGFTGTEYAQYNRALYGAALNWRSRSATALGDPRSLLKVFGAEARTALGHTEFLGTGGSLYYLRHTDVLPGSEQVVMEVRDPATGRVEARVSLQPGVDYEMDDLQGRLFLTRALSQITRENVRTLTRDTPLDGYRQVLLVDYEYVPSGFDSDDVTVGLRGRQWLGDHVAVGATYVDENRSGDDYSLKGADLTLQAGRGTYLRMEATRSESTVAPIFYSDNGGLSFIQRNPITGTRSGDARMVEARANLQELGWTRREWSLGAWWRDVDAGFSIGRQDTGLAIEEYGAEFLGHLNDDFSLYGRYSHASHGAQELEQTQLTFDWQLTEDGRFGGELRHLSERDGNRDADATLLALSYRQRFGDTWELYGVGQYTLDDDDGRYERNNLLTVGGKYLFGDRSSIGAEVSSGSRGHGGKLDAEYRLSPDHTLYGAYNYSTDRTERDGLFDTALQSGWTLGQRWRLNNQVNVYNESQYLRDNRRDGDGIVHTFGLDFRPAPGWNLGFTVMDGELDARDGRVDRRAYSVSGGRTDARTDWSSKLEYRRDRGAEQRTQWVTTNRLFHRVNEDWRLALRANYADTRDDLNPAAGARLAEANLGFAWRPHDNTRWAAFGKYTYLYDRASPGQEDADQYDQRSHVLSFEGTVQLDDRWQLAGKLAGRWGDYRMGRGGGAWLDSRTDFAAMQVRYHLIGRWDGLAEYRVLKVRDGGERRGWLVGLDRQIRENFKVGMGYNFTDFSGDLTQLDYRHKGWFLNITGYY